MNFLICWLLCSVAFVVWTVPVGPNPPGSAGVVAVMRILVSGVLVAIAISLVPNGLTH